MNNETGNSYAASSSAVTNGNTDQNVNEIGIKRKYIPLNESERRNIFVYRIPYGNDLTNWLDVDFWKEQTIMQFIDSKVVSEVLNKNPNYNAFRVGIGLRGENGEEDLYLEYGKDGLKKNARYQFIETIKTEGFEEICLNYKVNVNQFMAVGYHEEIAREWTKDNYKPCSHNAALFMLHFLKQLDYNLCDSPLELTMIIHFQAAIQKVGDQAQEIISMFGF